MFLFMQVRLSVEVPEAVCKDSYKRVLNELMKQVKVLVSFTCEFLLRCNR